MWNDDSLIIFMKKEELDKRISEYLSGKEYDTSSDGRIYFINGDIIDYTLEIAHLNASSEEIARKFELIVRASDVYQGGMELLLDELREKVKGKPSFISRGVI